jgi:hypothetical protein
LSSLFLLLYIVYRKKKGRIYKAWQPDSSLSGIVINNTNTLNMIRLFLKLCKCFGTIKYKNDYQLYMSFYNNAFSHLSTCPNCGSPTFSFHKDGNYDRNFICREDGKTICHIIQVHCVECDSCGHSHALLPSVIIPHSSFGLHFVITL